MNYRQKKGATKTQFDLGAERLQYSVEDSSGKANFALDYEDLPNETSEFVEKNTWYRNVGVLWMLLGLCFMGYDFIQTGEIGGYFWLVVGMITYGVYLFRQTEFTVFATTRGPIYVVKDDTHDQIIEDLHTRKADVLRQRYGAFNPNNEPEIELRKFRWLNEEGAISDEEYDTVVQQIRLGIKPSSQDPSGLHLN